MGFRKHKIPIICCKNLIFEHISDWKPILFSYNIWFRLAKKKAKFWCHLRCRTRMFWLLKVNIVMTITFLWQIFERHSFWRFQCFSDLLNDKLGLICLVFYFVLNFGFYEKFFKLEISINEIKREIYHCRMRMDFWPEFS